MVKRQAAESMTRQKEAMMAALYSNPNWDQKDAKRPEQIKEIEKFYSRAIELIYHPERAQEEGEEPDWNNPFWAAAKRSYDRMLELKKSQQAGTIGQAVPEFDKEQLQARESSRKQIDQVTVPE